MQIQEFHIGGRRDGVAAITRVINRHLRARELRRVEVRLSTRAASPPSAQQIKTAVSALLREHGLGAVEISVRAIELPIEDVLGEHVVRLLHAEADTPPGWPGWLAKWLAPRSFIGVEPVRSNPVAEAAMPQRMAVEMLKKALRAAVAADGPSMSAAPVSRVSIMVRQPELHLALAPLLTPGDAPTAAWIAEILKQHRLPVASAPRIDYDHRPPADGEGTVVGAGEDIEIHLDADAESADRGPSTVDVTALPLVSGAHDSRRAELFIRILGTTVQPFDRPFELRFDNLPARFDRAALNAAGFAVRHSSLLHAVSQNCPLLIARAADGGLELQAASRSGDSRQPMYFFADSRSGIEGTLRLHALRRRLIVNGPNLLVNPQGGPPISPLLMELDLRPLGVCSTALPMAA